MTTLRVLPLAALVSLSLLAACSPSQPPAAQQAQPSLAVDPWTQKPVLNYLLLTQDPQLEAEAQNLFQTLKLTPGEQAQLLDIARQEQQGVGQLAIQAQSQQSQGQQDVSAQAVSAYNLRVQSLVDSDDAEVRTLLGGRYGAFRDWIRAWWAREQAQSDQAQASQAASSAEMNGSAEMDAPGVTAQAATWPLLKQGAKGAAVESLQYLLRQHGSSVKVDSAFGPATEKAVVGFQKAQGLSRDGIVGEQTWGKLIVTLKEGSKGEAVRAVQKRLGLAVDGDFGPATRKAVVSFQKARGLTQDGVVGPNTWRALVGASGGGGGGGGGGGASSCRVFATQYAGHTSTEIALPDKYLKFANQGSGGPYKHPPYTAKVTYKSNTRSVRVLEVGPWNEDDNYWSANSRKFPGLGRCMPEAQAAYLKDYNGGKDQFGRRVTNPAGADLTPTFASSLGLGHLQNAWVTVSYSDLP